jgi:hypothetical protein
MPEDSKVARCVKKVMAQGHSKASAIRICQASTGQSYQTGQRAKLGRAIRKHKR